MDGFGFWLAEKCGCVIIGYSEICIYYSPAIAAKFILLLPACRRAPFRCCPKDRPVSSALRVVAFAALVKWRTESQTNEILLQTIGISLQTEGIYW